MVSFVIIICSSCGGFLAARTGQKTKRCSYCGSRITLQDSKHVGFANSAREASEILKIFKRKKAENQ